MYMKITDEDIRQIAKKQHKSNMLIMAASMSLVLIIEMIVLVYYK